MSVINGTHHQLALEAKPETPSETPVVLPGLLPDPIDGSRAGWEFCHDCAAIKPPEHVHGDPVEKMHRAELLELARAYVAGLGEVLPPRVRELLDAAEKRR